MLLTSVVSAVLVIFAAGLFVRTAQRYIADRRLKLKWIVVTVLVAAIELVLLGSCFMLGKQALHFLYLAFPLSFSGAMILYALLIKETIGYFNSISSVLGIKIVEPLTGAYNQIYLEQRLNSEIARSHRYGSPLSVVSLSVDDFTKLQEEFGHQAGGIAIRKVAVKLKDLLRETDVITTVGGGRFILILPDTPEGSVDGLITRLHGAIDEMEVINGADKEKSVSINVKFGKSHCGLKTDGSAELISHAIAREAVPEADLLRVA